MARVPFVGESFSLLAPAASAAKSINCFPEVIDDPQMKQKNNAIIRFAPGQHLLKTLTHSKVRGMWSGGGRLFVVSGAFYYEVVQGSYPGTPGGGSIISSQDLGSNDTLPAQLFGNGNQLGIVANGFFYIDNGSGAVKARFQVEGTVSISGPTVTWEAGDKFPAYTPTTADPLPTVIFINGNPYAVTFTSNIAATLAISLAGGSGFVTLYGDSGDVFWESGTAFSTSWEGGPIVIDGVTYTIAIVLNAGRLQIVERPGGISFGLAFTVTVGGFSYSAAGGDLVTAVTGAYLDGTFLVQRPSGLPNVTYTDLVIDATHSNAVTSAANPFTTANIGEVITITGGAGFTTGKYSVINVSSGIAGLSAPVGTVGSTGGTGTGTLIGVDLGRQVNFSGVNDGTFWRGIDFFTKEGGPDYIASIISDHELLYVFGTEESEVWQFDPNTGQPVRESGAAAREGCPATWSPTALSETIYFIGGSPRGGPIAYKLQGFVPQRISTHAVEDAWVSAILVPSTTDGTAFSYIDQGHRFWVVNFGGNVGAWVYDETASALLGSPQWHQRSSGGVTGPYRWWFHTYIPEWGTQGMHIVGDYNSADLCEMNMSFADEEGTVIQWQKDLPYRWNGTNRIYYGRMDLEMATGLVASGAEPTITRSYSMDRGQNFVNPQTAGIGVHNEFSRRVFWPQGGSDRGRVWRFAGNSQVGGALIDLNCEDKDGTV